MMTSSKTGHSKPKVFLSTNSTREPQNIQEALSSPVWFNAMKKEYSALIGNNTWTHVPKLQNLQVIGCKWVYRVKHNPYGTVQRHKARLVAKRFNQIPGFDFTETFSPVVKPITIRVLLHLLLLGNGVSDNWTSTMYF